MKSATFIFAGLVLVSHVAAQTTSLATSAPNNDAATAAPSPSLHLADRNYHLQADDVVEVTIFREPDLTTQGVVAQDGSFDMKLIGAVKVVGQTADQAGEAIRAALARDYLAPTNCDAVTDLFTPRLAHFSYVPGSVDFDRSLDAMIRTTGLLGTTLVTVWLGRDLVWRRLLLGTMVLTAAGVSFLGCLQRWTHAGDIFWAEGRHLDFFFATYRNVTNAGEYLNLALPLSGAGVLYAILRKDAPLLRALAVTAWTLIATGAWICGSRLAPGMSLLGLATLLFLTRRLVACTKAASTRVRGRSLIAGAGLLFTMVLGAGMGTTVDRLHRLLEPGGGETALHRWQVDQVCLLAARDCGLAGFGPGTFASIFPYYSGRIRGGLDGYWAFAHDDYVQAVVEWGWLGAAFWAVHFYGGIVMLYRGWRRGGWTVEDRLTAAGLLVALGLIAATALIDFPLQIASIQLDLAVLLGLAWSSGRWHPAWPRGLSRSAEGWNFLAWAGRSPNVLRSTVS